jgi:ATP-dependent helicase HrpA
MSETKHIPSPEELEKFSAGIKSAMPAERPGLRRGLKILRQRLAAGQPSDRIWKEMQGRYAESRELFAWRRKNLPRPKFPDDLPVAVLREDIKAVLEKSQITIIAGETGSGKTTQLPKICLAMGRGVGGAIGCTQPRRIAAISMAERVAEELGGETGGDVGYQIRFDSRVSPKTFVKFMTDGILLAETQGDKFLSAYDTIIIDEAHERSLNIDFLLGYLKNILPARRDLKIIVSSATLDVERFSEFFEGAPIVRVEGRTYPVRVRYRPAAGEDTDLSAQVAEVAASLVLKEEPGDILVFLSGEQDICETVDALERKALPETEVLPLYGRLTPAEQRKVFHPGVKRRIIVSTNVAETSVTVPRIRYVIDSGVARIKRFDYRTQVERLLIEPISQASAEQRKGRCGRLGSGVCVRLYPEDDFFARPEYTDPEIRRSSLASVILQMMSSGLGAVEEFPFIEPPTSAMIRAGYDELLELGAITEDRQLTETGRQMSRFPLEPRFSRMLLAAAKNQALEEVSIIVAALSIQDPRARPVEKQGEADAAHKRFLTPESDFLGWLKLWEFFQDAQKSADSNSKLRRVCTQHFLSYQRMREWVNTVRQLRELAKTNNLSANRAKALPEAVHQSLLAGLLSRVGRYDKESKDYAGTRGTRFHIFPGSGLFNTAPVWVMCAELVTTSRLFARSVATVKPEWIELQAGDLLKRSYSNPQWDAPTGFVRAAEQATLLGLTIVDGRRRDYSMIDPVEARRIFIEDALVKRQLQSSRDFYRHNRKLVEGIEETQHRLRRTDLLVDDAAIYDFYDRHLPPEVCSRVSLEKWLDRAEKKHPRLLFLRREDVEMVSSGGLDGRNFPKKIAAGEMLFKASYAFNPGADDDGVTCAVPVGVLPHLEKWRFDWLVPGLLAEKVALLLRGLPRGLRKELVPIPETCGECLKLLKHCEKPLEEALTAALIKIRKIRIVPGDFRLDDLPEFLKMRFRVIDANGNELCAGRDLEKLRGELSVAARETRVEISREKYEQTEITDWVFGEWREQIEMEGTGGKCVGFPALVDEGKSVALRIRDSRAEAACLTRFGLRRLFALQLDSQLRNIRKSLALGDRAKSVYASFGGKIEELKNDILGATLDEAFDLVENPGIKDGEDFSRRLEQGRGEVFGLAYRFGEACDAFLPEAGKIAVEIFPAAKGQAVAAARGEMIEQLQALIFSGFLREMKLADVEAMPRYLEALRLRWEKLRVKPTRDRAKAEEFNPFWQNYQAQRRRELDATGFIGEELRQFRWMLEEFRVSLFAQEIKTAYPVSPKRLREKWELVLRAAQKMWQ